jgi:threonine/homoserine/homoserine lactone efflux protein
VLEALKWIGAAFLLWLARKITTATPSSAETRAEAIGFSRAAAFQWINPKSWLVAASAAGTYLGVGESGVLHRSLIFGGLFAAAALPACFPWLLFGAGIQRRMRDPATARRFNRVMGIALAASLLLLLH